MQTRGEPLDVAPLPLGAAAPGGNGKGLSYLMHLCCWVHSRTKAGKTQVRNSILLPCIRSRRTKPRLPGSLGSSEAPPVVPSFLRQVEAQFQRRIAAGQRRRPPPLPSPARCLPARGCPAGLRPAGRAGWGQRDRLSSAALLLRPAAQRAAENSPCNYSSIPPSAGERELEVFPRLRACPVQIIAGSRTRSEAARAACGREDARGPPPPPPPARSPRPR